MSTQGSHFEGGEYSPQETRFWITLRKTLAFLIIFSLVSNDLARAGREGGYASDDDARRQKPSSSSKSLKK